jgi:acetyl esterase/lipase
VGASTSAVDRATQEDVLSDVVHMHSRLVALGVETRLHVWEGLDHVFIQNPDLNRAKPNGSD